MMAQVGPWWCATTAAPGQGASASPAAGPPASVSAAAPLLNVVLELGLLLLVVAVMICIYRLLRGPMLADRITALDTLSFEVTALVIVLAIRFGTPIFFDAALVVALMGFVSTVAFAQYIGAGAEATTEAEQEGLP